MRRDELATIAWQRGKRYRMTVAYQESDTLAQAYTLSAEIPSRPSKGRRA